MPDWRGILAARGVSFVERGANVKRGELNVRCPWCGTADPSHHLGIDPATGWYACWRNRKHGGKSQVRLAMALLRVGFLDACDLVGVNDAPSPEGFATLRSRLSAHEQEASDALPTAKWPGDFKRITRSGRSRWHWEYLRYERGFWMIDDLVERYDLRYAENGPFANRVLLPYVVDGIVVTWTGRAIAPATVRYMAARPEDATVTSREVLFNENALNGSARVLVLVEGPLDALKLDWAGCGQSVAAVAWSTRFPTTDHVLTLAAVRARFEVVVAMGDRSFCTSPALSAALAPVRDIVSVLPPFGRKDAGELTRDEAEDYTASLLTNGGRA